MTGTPSDCFNSCTAEYGPWPRSCRSREMTRPVDLRACGRDNLVGLADSGSGRDDVIDDEHATGKRRADDAATLAMRLGLFAVERVRHVDVVLLG